MKARLRFTVGSVPDRDDLVAHLLADDVVWAQISQEGDHLAMAVFPNPAGVPWTLPLDEVQLLIEAARHRLEQLGLVR